LLHRSPHQAGLERSRWWLAGLRQAVSALHNYSLVGIWRLLRRWRLVYKRGRHYVHSPDPDYDTKLAYLEAARQMSQREPQRFVLLYADELTYYQRPSLARAYAPSGHDQLRVLTGHQPNRQRRIAAALHPPTGQLLAWQRTRFRVPTLLAFLRTLEAAYPQAERIFIAWDNWPTHFHPHISLALQTSRLTLLRLPTYAPWTNPVEKVWLRLKREVLHHHPYPNDWLSLQGAVEAWLRPFATGSLDLLHSIGLSPP